MPKSPVRLSDEELNQHIINVAKPSVKFIKKQIMKSLDFISNKHKNDRIDPVDFINMVICAAASINVNILRTLKTFHQASVGKELNYKGLIEAFDVNLAELLKVELAEHLKEKLN
jgi:hypothetical protein